MVQTVEVIRTGNRYFLIQDRDTQTTVSLAEYIERKTGGKPPKAAPKFLTPKQLQSVILQMLTAFETFTIKKKLVHGSLDVHSVFVEESSRPDELRTLIDPSEFYGLKRLLK